MLRVALHGCLMDWCYHTCAVLTVESSTCPNTACFCCPDLPQLLPTNIMRECFVLEWGCTFVLQARAAGTSLLELHNAKSLNV